MISQLFHSTQKYRLVGDIWNRDDGTDNLGMLDRLRVAASGGAEILTTRSGSRLRAEMRLSPC